MVADPVHLFFSVEEVQQTSPVLPQCDGLVRARQPHQRRGRLVRGQQLQARVCYLCGERRRAAGIGERRIGFAALGVHAGPGLERHGALALAGGAGQHLVGSREREMERAETAEPSNRTPVALEGQRFAVGRTGGAMTRGCVVPRCERFDRSRCGFRRLGGAFELGRRTRPLLCRLPVMRNAGRRMTCLFEHLRHGPMQCHRDAVRHGAQRGFENEVVGERAVAHHLGLLQREPCVGQVEHVGLQHCRRQFGREVCPGQRGHACEAQSVWRQVRQSPLQQRADVRRRGQCGRRARGLPRRDRAGQLGLERFKDEQRVAAGVTRQRFGPGVTVEFGNGK